MDFAQRRFVGVCAAIAALALGAGTAGGVAAGDEETVELEPLVVTAPGTPLDRSLHLLRILVEQSTPCLGCDTVLRQRPRPVRDLLSYLLLPTPPPDLDESTRLLHEIKLQDSPDLDYLRP